MNPSGNIWVSVYHHTRRSERLAPRLPTSSGTRPSLSCRPRGLALDTCELIMRRAFVNERETFIIYAVINQIIVHFPFRDTTASCHSHSNRTGLMLSELFGYTFPLRDRNTTTYPIARRVVPSLPKRAGIYR